MSPTPNNQFEEDFNPTPAPAAPNQMSPIERLRALQESANAPVICEKCGSDWFYEVELHQYRGGMYSSAPGGELQIVSTMPQRIRLCLCGHPVSPNLSGYRGGRQPNQAINSFRSALAVAHKYRAVVDELNAKVQAITEQAATIRDIEQIQVVLNELKATVVSKAAAPAPAPVPQTPPENPNPAVEAAELSEEAAGQEGESKKPGRPKKMRDPWTA